MATGAEVFRRNAALIYNTYQTEFNRILETLIANERVTPGSITAAVNDLARQEAALKNERDALERLRLEGQKSDAQLLATLQELKGRGAIASMEQATSASIARGRLREALSNEVTGQRQAGRDDFRKAYGSKAVTDLETEGFFPTGGTKQQVEGDLQELGKTYVETLMEGAPTDPIAAAQYRDSVLAKTKDYLFSRVQKGSEAERRLAIGGMSAQEKSDYFSGLAKRSAVRGGIDVTAPTPQQAEAEVRNELESIARQVRGGGNVGTLSQRAAVLGVDEGQLKELVATLPTEEEERKAAEQQTGVDVVKRAAYYSSKLPGSEFEFPTYAAYQTALERRDPEAIELYNLTLKKNPSFIQLLSGGEYTARMQTIARKEADIDKRRKAYDELVREGRRPVDYEKLYNKARSIYTNLFTARGRMDERRRAEEAQEAVRREPALAGALDQVMEEEGVSKAKRDAVTSALPAASIEFIQAVGAPDQDVDLNFTRGEAERVAASDTEGLVFGRNEAGDVVLAGTDTKLTDLTFGVLMDRLLEPVRIEDPTRAASLEAFRDRMVQQMTEASPRDRRYFAGRLKGVLEGMTNLASQSQARQDAAIQAAPLDTQPFVREAPVLPTPTTTGPAIPTGEGAGQGQMQLLRRAIPAEPTIQREGAMLQPPIPADTATAGTDMAYMAAGQLAAVGGDRAIADQTFNQTVTADEYNRASKEVMKGAAQEFGIDQRAIDAVETELAALEELGRVGGPNPTADQITDIVPEAGYNQGVLTYASMVARNAYDTKNIS